MEKYILPALIYFVIISLISVWLTVKDKKAAINNKWRVPESTLMILGLFGGAVAMLITMKKIRHKTKHAKFMVGLPIEIALQIVILVLLYIKVFQGL